MAEHITEIARGQAHRLLPFPLTTDKRQFHSPLWFALGAIREPPLQLEPFFPFLGLLHMEESRETVRGGMMHAT